MPQNSYRIENRLYDFPELPAEGEALQQFVEKQRRQIEPWLSAIFQSEHLALLVGSGFSIGLARAVGAISVSMAPTSFVDALDSKITAAATKTAKRMGRHEPNIEDQLSVCIALVEGLEIIGDAQADDLRKAVRRELLRFANSIVEMESDILAKVNASGEKLQIFRDLLSSFLLSFASRTATRDRLHLFTTNYDRTVEHGFDLIGIRPIDRFVGGLSPTFRSSRFDVDIHYSPQGARLEARPLEGVVRYGKLHGSVDWFYENGCVRRHASAFGQKSPHLQEDSADALMIYPNPAKDVETAFYPYADLFRDFSAALCRPNSSLITYGYGFGDDHINRIIGDMLSLPSTHLVVISYDDHEDRIARFVRNAGRLAQISFLIGPHFASLETLTAYYLPKPAIDTISIRKNELIERRGRGPGDEGSKLAGSEPRAAS
jgi:hypothetical protein